MVDRHRLVYLPGHVAIEAADEVLLREAFDRPPGDIGDGGFVKTHADNDRPLERTIGLSMPSP
jgi:hypothetical protein